MSRGGTIRLHPDDPAYSQTIARNRLWRDYHLAVADPDRGPDHPDTIALWGRIKFHEGWTPQRGRIDVAAVAWHRESGTIVGFDNRAERKSKIA